MNGGEMMQPLQKVHYSYPLQFDAITDEQLLELTRLTHACSIRGEWATEDQTRRAVGVCQQVNSDNPSIRASIGVNYSVWHRAFGKLLPPTDVGPTHDEELRLLRNRLMAVSGFIAGSGVEVTAILFECERFYVKSNDREWNRAVTNKYNQAYDVAKDVFANASVQWYMRGGYFTSADATGWSESQHFVGDEKGDGYSCSLYQVPEIGYTREAYRKTAANSVRHGCFQVTPWIALGAGYQRTYSGGQTFAKDWDYDPIYSWQLGAEINHQWFGKPERHERFAPWNMAQVAVFYPAPFTSPHWQKHFQHYVAGSHLVEPGGEGEE